MAKKKNWLTKLKRLFLSDAHSKPEKEKRRRWLFQRLKIYKLPTIAPPPQPPLLGENEQRNHDFTVAIATGAAVDAAAQAAAEPVQLTGMPQSPFRVQPGGVPLTPQCHKEIQDSAAVKIQTAFRGHLARKALRALKGLVKLQAIVRGRAVRRQAMTTLKCLQSMVSIQSQICEQRSHLQTFDNGSEYHDYKEWQDLRNKAMKIEMNSPRRWDDSILTKEEANAVFLNKKEAILKRERIKEYVLSHRRSADQEQKKVNKNLRYWLEQWVDTKLAKIEDLEELDSVISSNPITKNHRSQYRLEGLVSPISDQRRRSFHQKKQSNSKEEQGRFHKNPTPTYMLATESAKNKSRLIGNSPKLRPVNFDTFSEGNSPYKNKLSVLSSVSSEVITSGRMGKFDGFHYRSPSLKEYNNGYVKSGRVLKDQSFDSERSLFIWDR